MPCFLKKVRWTCLRESIARAVFNFTVDVDKHSASRFVFRYCVFVFRMDGRLANLEKTVLKLAVPVLVLGCLVGCSSTSKDQEPTVHRF
jgi:hypothetical protein